MSNQEFPTRETRERSPLLANRRRSGAEEAVQAGLEVAPMAMALEALTARNRKDRQDRNEAASRILEILTGGENEVNSHDIIRAIVKETRVEPETVQLALIELVQRGKVVSPSLGFFRSA